HISNASALDIGANIGNHGLYFSDYFKKVRCVEPSRRIFSVLKLNSEIVTNIECHNFGLSSSDRIASLRSDATNIGSGAVDDTLDAVAEQIVLKRLDAVDFGTEEIKLLKIDVEGHEYDALKGARGTISKHAPIIL